MDLRLLSAIADSGRAAVHEIAARLGMDVRDVAARLAALSTTGLPIVVGVECDPNGIRHALAAANTWNQHSGPYQAGGPSGPYQVPNPQVSGPFPGHTGNSGPYPAYPGPQPFAPAGPPSSFGAQQQNPVPQPQGGVPQQQQVPPHPMNTWGPPGSASWARAEQPTVQTPKPAPKTGKVGTKLDVEGMEGEQITIQLVEVVDPADFLFTAAGHQLQVGERSVVVHTELANRGTMPFTSLPDLYLVLVTTDGSAVTKSPVSLSSRPPHKIGAAPGETTGGHTIYVLPEDTELTAVRWTLSPGDEKRTLTWDISDI